mmetsp:Transcript_27846/g.47338  ORF Transcript_27846/g.47338 Transcript_27846/m.47338 type:complete len:198 (+) Transcript_27846:192-785(+)
MLVVGDDAVICESLVVSEYVAELQAKLAGGSESEALAKSGLQPCNPEDRAVVRLFIELCSSRFAYFPIVRAQNEKQHDEALEQFKSGLKDVDAFLRNMGGRKGPFLLGEQFTLAECNTAPFVQRACTVLPAGLGNSPPVDPLVLCDELGLERLKSWIEAVLARSSVHETGVPKKDMLKNMKRMIERLNAMEKDDSKQ